MDDGLSLSRRRLLRAAGAAGVGGVASVGATPVAGAGECSGPRTDDGNLPFDTGGKYGGWGGHEFHGTDPGTDQNPVVFVHGNTRDACGFLKHAGAYLERGYLGGALWAVTFREETSTHRRCETNSRGSSPTCCLHRSLDRRRGRAQPRGHRRAVLAVGVRPLRQLRGARRTRGRQPRDADVSHLHRLPRYRGALPVHLTAVHRRARGAALRAEPPRRDAAGGLDGLLTVRETADSFYPVHTDSPRLEGAERNVVLEGATHDEVRESDRSIDLQYRWTTS